VQRNKGLMHVRVLWIFSHAQENLRIFPETDAPLGSTCSPSSDNHYPTTLVGGLFWVSG